MGSKRRATEVVQAARGRLKGALQDVVNIGDDDENHDSVPSRGRPPKRPKKEPTPPPPVVNHSFIMKLFDRSVDLAKYNKETALYPICRAWMINQPRSPSILSFINREIPEPAERKPLPALVADITMGKKIDINEMPACSLVEISRIPSPLPFQKESNKDNIDLDYDLNQPKISRKDILTELKTRSVQIKKKWQQTSKLYEDTKYEASMKILEHIYKK